MDLPTSAAAPRGIERRPSAPPRRASMPSTPELMENLGAPRRAGSARVADDDARATLVVAARLELRQWDAELDQFEADAAHRRKMQRQREIRGWIFIAQVAAFTVFLIAMLILLAAGERDLVDLLPIFTRA